MFEFLSERVALKVGLTLLTTPGSTVAILAQGTSWAVAVTQAFLVAVQILLPAHSGNDLSLNLELTYFELGL